MNNAVGVLGYVGCFLAAVATAYIILALGGSSSLALVCDFVVAYASAIFWSWRVFR